MKFLVGLALCCAAIFVVADAFPGGAPVEACINLIPGSSGHGTLNTEQTGDNPWTGADRGGGGGGWIGTVASHPPPLPPSPVFFM